MRCVAVRHEEFEDLGTLATVLSSRGWEIEYVDAPRAASLAAAVGDPDLLVLLGGPMGAYQTDRHPFLREEIALAAARLRGDRPLLGVCLGAQIMAAALGARVYPAPAPEIGWYPIEGEAGAESDPAASRMIAGRPIVLHWHYDTFDLPAGAIRLARSRRTPHQGFRYRRTGYALQFHLEVDPERIHEWTDGHAAALASTPGIASASEIESGATRFGPAMVRRTRAFFGTYLDLLR